MKTVDMTRGKPSEDQLLLTWQLERKKNFSDYIVEGIDIRNYGVLEGLQGARALLSPILQVPPAQVIAFGNSSLTLMFLYARWLLDRYKKETGRNTAKWIALTPGYDRHFAICEELGIELISVPMTATGPDISAIQSIINQDNSVIGMWCVPKYSNPCGVVYSDEAVMGCISLLQESSPYFTIFWDNAYGIHDFDPLNPTPLLPIMQRAEEMKLQDKLALFCSTSKITYAGGGLAGMGLSVEMKKHFLKHLGVISIGPDKLVQQKHIQLFSEPTSLTAHMKEHAALMMPKFEAVLSTFADRLYNTPGVRWSKPKGGYFISLYTPHGTAKKICTTARDKGIILTQAGSAYPYGHDPEDAHLRIAPSYPSLEDVTYAANIICDAVNEVIKSM